MLSIPHPTYRQLPLSVLESDPTNPRWHGAFDDEDERLLQSVKTFGVLTEIVVTETQPGRFRIIDGERRFICAKAILLESVPCTVYPKLSRGDVAYLRFIIEDTFKPLTLAECTKAMRQIQAAAKEADE